MNSISFWPGAPTRRQTMSGNGSLGIMVLVTALKEQDTETPHEIWAPTEVIDDAGHIRAECLCGFRLLLPIGARRCPSCGQLYSVKQGHFPDERPIIDEPGT